MAIASNIDVDSAAFAAFQDKFNQFKAALDKTPAQWRSVGAQPVLKITDRRRRQSRQFHPAKRRDDMQPCALEAAIRSSRLNDASAPERSFTTPSVIV